MLQSTKKAGGIPPAFRLIKEEGLFSFENHGHALTAADAESSQTVLALATLHFVHQGNHDSGAGSADRMTEGDTAAVDVADLGVNAHFSDAADSLSGESFIQFKEIDIFNA